VKMWRPHDQQAREGIAHQVRTSDAQARAATDLEGASTDLEQHDRGHEGEVQERQREDQPHLLPDREVHGLPTVSASGS